MALVHGVGDDRRVLAHDGHLALDRLEPATFAMKIRGLEHLADTKS